MKKIFWGVQAALFYLLTLIAAILPASLTYRFGTYAGLLIPLIPP